MGTLAIIDSRNVHGQTKNVLGVGLTPSVDGVIEGLGLYGFDVTEVRVGLALARPRDEVALQSMHDANLKYQAEVESHVRGKALLGELHLHGTDVDEKIVDVRCAINIAIAARDIADGNGAFDSIVVCSQDIDLSPALEYAVELGVPIWVAAHDVVDSRPQSYLLMTCEALRRFRPPSVVSGHERRALVARAALAPDTRTWEFIEPWGEHRYWFVQDADGTPALCEPRTLGLVPSAGQKVTLGVAGISLDRRRNDFPILMLGKNPSAQPLATLGEVVKRHGALEVEIIHKSLTRKMRYPIGGVLPGTNVAIHEQVDSEGKKLFTIVGPSSPSSVSNPLKVCAVAAIPLVAVSTGVQLGPNQTKVTTASGLMAAKHAHNKHLEKGKRVAVVVVDPKKAPGYLPVTVIISSAL